MTKNELSERKSRIAKRVIAGFLLLFFGILAIFAFVLINVQKQGQIDKVYVVVFIVGMILLISSYFPFFHARRMAKVYCKYCGSRYDYKKDVKFSGKLRRFLLLNTVKAKYTCRCRNCKNTTAFSRIALRIHDSTLDADLKETGNLLSGYFD